MKRVTGLGGVFFKSKQPGKMKEWYDKHLGIPSGKYGGMFKWRDHANPEKECFTAWSIFENDSTYFGPSQNDYMFNYRVEDLEALLKVLKKEGVEIIGEMEVFDYGKFGWIMDPEGNKIELWEPIDQNLAGTAPSV